MKKRNITCLLVGLILSAVFLSVPAYAVSESPELPIKVTIDGKEQVFDVPPMGANGRVFVPFRAIFEALGAIVDWDSENQLVGGIREDALVILKLNCTTALVNGEEKELDAAPFVVNNRTMVPVRFIAESLGETVEWDQKTRTVIIKTAAYIGNEANVAIIDENQTPVQIGNPLPGKWKMHKEQGGFIDMHFNFIKGAVTDSTFLFNQDGTFIRNVITSKSNYDGESIIKGKYKAEGNFLILYERFETWIPNPETNAGSEPYKDRLVSDKKEEFCINSKGELEFGGDSYIRE